MSRKISRAYNYLVKSRSADIPFIILKFFLLTFLLTRAYVYITQHDVMNLYFLTDYITIRGIHIHHFSWGILLMAVTGFLAIWDIRPAIVSKLAILYGIGLGLTFDEFAIWLRLNDDYGARLTYDSIIIIILIFLNIIYFPGFWTKVGRKLKS